MKRTVALSLSILSFLIFFVIAYMGVRIEFFSSFVLAIFISFIILNIFYPVSNLAQDSPDSTLIVYAVYQIFTILIIAIYILYRTLTDVRK